MKRLLIMVLLFTASQLSWAAPSRAIGSFEILDKQWFVVALTQADAEHPEKTHMGTRLELKAVDEVSPRRFRQLWQDALAVNESATIWQDYEADFDTFFNLVQEALLPGDRVAFQQDEESVAVIINHYEHARLSKGFLSMVLASLTARIAPIPSLKQGLLAQLPQDEQKRLYTEFSSGDVSLQRIAQTSRWMRFPKSRVSQL